MFSSGTAACAVIHDRVSERMLRPAVAEVVEFGSPALRPLRPFLRHAWRQAPAVLSIGVRLAKRDLRRRYRESALGYVWLLVPTVPMAVIWTYLRSRGVVDVDGVESYPVFALAGLVLWQTFVDALTAPGAALSAGRSAIARTTVPLEALVVGALLEVLVGAAARSVVVALAMAIFGIAPPLAAALVPVGVVGIALLGTLFGALLAPLSLLYGDVGRSVTLIASMWFFVTPVVYDVPSGGILGLNPVAPLLQTTRTWLLGGETCAGFAAVIAITLPGLLVVGLALRSVRPHLAAVA